jgi:hypothetical protein
MWKRSKERSLILDAKTCDFRVGNGDTRMLECRSDFIIRTDNCREF